MSEITAKELEWNVKSRSCSLVVRDGPAYRQSLRDFLLQLGCTTFT